MCDTSVFSNQCAMRMGTALRTDRFDRVDRVDLSGFFNGPAAHGLGAKLFTVYPGSIDRNIAELKDKRGMIFILNGWGSTDHIDVWKGNGTSGSLKGGFDAYFSVGTQVWLWEF